MQSVKRQFVHGFTLIEVMIVVAIIAILAAVALPAYGDYIRRGQLPEAFTFLSDYRVKMEQYYQDNRNYGTGGACANAAGTASWNNFIPSGKKYFDFSCELTNGGQGFRLKATGVTARAVGHVYTITDANIKATTTFKGGTVSKTCWLVSGTEC